MATPATAEEIGTPERKTHRFKHLRHVNSFRIQWANWTVVNTHTRVNTSVVMCPVDLKNITVWCLSSDSFSHDEHNLSIPESMSAKLPPHTEAIEDDPVHHTQQQNINEKNSYTTHHMRAFTLGNLLPLDSSTSDVTRMVKGKSVGMTGLKAFSASAPTIKHTWDSCHSLLL